VTDYDLEVGLLLMKMQRHFAEINADKSLTEADKKQLKDFYLQDLIARNGRNFANLAHTPDWRKCPAFPLRQSFEARFSQGPIGSPVSKTPAREGNAITNR
jgi:hypothetical protein